MNNRTLRVRVGAVLLVLALCLTVLPAAAASVSMQTVYLDSAEEFAAFAKSCSLDTWSQGKTFILRADISLSGVDFTPAASFGGTFEGAGIPSPISISRKMPAPPGCSARSCPADAWQT